MQSDIINAKIDDLIDLAQKEGDNNTVIVLLILRGSKHVNDDGLFADMCQRFAQDVLLPKTIRDRDNEKAALN